MTVWYSHVRNREKQMETVSPVIMELNTVVVIIGTTVTAVLALVGLVWTIVHTTVNRSENRLREDRRDSENRLQQASKDAHAQIGERIDRIEAGNVRIEKKVDELLMRQGIGSPPEPSGSTRDRS